MSRQAVSAQSLVLDGQGIPSTTSSQTIHTALHDAQSPLANSIMRACHQMLLRDFGSMSSEEQENSGLTVTDFATPNALLELALRYQSNAIVANIHLYLVQLLRYLAHANDTLGAEEDCTSVSDIYGFSSGMLAATVIACAKDIPSLISHAISVFRFAFWLGVRSEQHARTATNGIVAEASPAATWSLVVFGSTRGEIQQAIDRYTTAYPSRPRLYLSAVTHVTCISISGRPQTLETFRSRFLPPTSTTSRYMPIHALYHAPELVDVKADIINDLASRSICFPDYADLNHRLRSTVTGEVIYPKDGYSLMEEVLDMILLHPVNFDYITTAINNVHERVASISSRTLINIGPGNVLWRSIPRTCPQVAFSMVDWSAASKADLPEPSLSPSMPAARDNALHREPVAIVGMALKFPQADNASELWNILEQGLNTVSEIPETRFNVSEYSGAHRGSGRSMKTKYGNFLDDPSSFDHTFFRVSPREARSMDPQQRLLLHVSHHALENAGYVPGSTQSFDPDTFAVYVGVATNDYALNLRKDVDVYYTTGTMNSFLSGKVSYAFGFSGPSLVIDTACSSSMVAIHQACRALNNKDCNAALAGGVNVITSPDMYIGLDRAHFLSSTGQCKPWDASADGYCRAEGCGMFVLKRLSDALAENDNILGVIRGIEVNQSARADSITQPHVPTQIDLFKKLLASTSIDPKNVSVIEAHGTGTKAGDPTEIQSIRTVFAQNRSSTNPLHLTSIKANIGHAEAASGAASLVKLLLMLRNRTIPPMISLKQLNPKIKDLASDGTCIDTELVPWIAARASKRLALLNNFGAAGSNAALILEEVIATPRSTDHNPHAFVLGLSCDSEEALEKQRFAYLRFLREDLADSDAVGLGDFTYTATARRQQYDFRLSAAGKTKQELCSALEGARPAEVRAACGKVVFVFSGQGGQYVGMGAQLYHTLPAFRRVVDYCHGKLLEWGFDGILHVISPQDEDTKDDFQAYQCAVFALECALAAVWSSWGLKPDAVVGHSLGEYAALVSAEVINLDDALKLVGGRARLMAEKCAVEESGMLAVKIAPGIAAQIIDGYDDVTIACYNSCEDVVMAGKLGQLGDLQATLKASHRKCTRVKVPYAYHTSAMTPVLDSLTVLANEVALRPPSIPIISNVHGTVVCPGDASVFTAEYFARHCGEPVRFEQGIRNLRGLPDFDGACTWLEMGPHPTTLPMLRAGTISTGATFLASLRKNTDDWQTLSETLSAIYTLPNTLQWRAVFADIVPDARLVDLPPYPFSKTRFWVPYEEEASAPVPEVRPSPLTTRFTLLGSCMSLPALGSSDTAVFETPISKLSHLIEGHTVSGYGLCPASVYIEMACAASELVLDHLGQKVSESVVTTSEINFSNPLVYAQAVPRIVRTSVSLTGSGQKLSGTFTISSYVSDPNVLQAHCSGSVQVSDPSSIRTKLESSSTTVDRRRRAVEANGFTKHVECFHTRMIYEVIFSRIVAYSSSYHTIQKIDIDPNGVDAFAVMRLPRDTFAGSFTVHPVFTDTLLHAAGFVINCNVKQNEAFICSQVDKVKILPSLLKPEAQYGVYCNIGFMSDTLAIADAYAFELGKADVVIVAHVKRMRFRKLRLSGFTALLLAAASPSSAASPTVIHHPSHVSSREPATSCAAEAVPSSKPRLGSLVALDTRSELGRIKDVMASVLGLQSQQLSEDEDLERLGLDSLTSIEAHHTLCAVLKVNLPEDLFATCRSVRDIKSAMTFASTTAGLPPTPVTAHSETALADAASDRFVVAEANDLHDPLRQVVDIMASVLGIAVDELSVSEDLERLGMDSLMSIEAHHAICAALKVTLPDDLFMSCKTIQEVQRAIEASRPVLTPAKPMSFGTEVNPVRFQTGAADAAPLFLIHDGSGIAHCYGRLSPLGRSVWGIHNPKFSTGEGWAGGLLEMAVHYAGLILDKLVRGQRCVVGGWSVGGVIAFEVARQLMSLGVGVDGLVLIDSPHPHTSAPLSDDVISSAFSKHPSSIALELVKAQMKHATRALVAYDPASSPAQGFTPRKAVMLRSRNPFVPAGGKLSDEFLSDRDDSSVTRAGWEIVLGYDIAVLDIPGDHFEPFEPCNVEEVSLRIREALSLLDE
ncbi:beta-ketoacyl synthase [Cytidiella melzeri]|nr:beta-ketoacyl synthase [Cytidiella melzeri]